MSVEENRTALLRFYEAVNRRAWEELQSLMAEDYVNHNRAPEQAAGVVGVVATLRGLVGQLPDLRMAPINVIAESELAAGHLKITGTHRSGRAVAITMTEMVRFTDGKMVERWGNHDELQLMRDLGIAK